MSTCQEVKQSYEDLLAKQKKFIYLRSDIADKDTRGQMKRLQGEIEPAIENLREIVTPKEIKELVEQYDRQVKMLERVGILEKGKRAITGIDGVEYPLPESIKPVLMAEKEKILKKKEQGFGRLLLVPFGMPLETLVEIYKKVILEHAKAGTIDAEVDVTDCLEISDEWLDKKQPKGKRGADVAGKCVYHAKKLVKGDRGGGLTKQEILEKQKREKSATAGWRILMVETEKDIPREGKGKIVGKRKQIEAGKSATEYLKMLMKPEYAFEQGMSLEDWLMLAILFLEEKQQVIDNWQAGGSFCRLPGTFNFSSGWLASATWRRGIRLADLGNAGPGIVSGFGGVRFAVEINK
jgi:hypothetical protein